MRLPSSPHDPYAPLRIRNFRWFIVSLMAMTLATQIRGVVVAWQIYQVTKDPLSLGLIGLAEALPFLAAALVAGHVADRRDRQRVSLWSLVLLLGCALALLLLTVVPSRMAGARVWPYYAVIFVTGIGRSFLMPARSALGAELVPRELYSSAVTWRSSTWQLAAVIGPAVGGLVYAFAGAPAAYALDVALMTIAVLALARVAHPPRAIAPAEGSMLRSLGEGVGFVIRQRVIFGAMTLDLFSVLFGGAVALLPVFAADILAVGPEGLGALRAAPAAGALVMSFALAHRPPLRHAGRAILVNVALFGVCMIGFGLSRNFLLSLAFLAASGMVDTVSVVVRSTLLQIMTPQDLLGRVSAVNAIFIGSSNEVGAFESGVAARLFGTVPSVVLGGVATLLVVGTIAVRVPELRRLREIHPPLVA